MLVDVVVDIIDFISHAPAALLATVAARSPFNRLATVEDIADIAAFIASNSSRWISGQVIVANGAAKL